jgi:hypothetical protein
MSDPPPPLTRDGPGHPVASSRSFQYHVDFTKYRGIGKRQYLLPGMIGHGHRPYARLGAGTRVQESIPSPSNIATVPRVHA